MRALVYYVSGHGYGHATRVAAALAALLAQPDPAPGCGGAEAVAERLLALC